MAGAAELLTVGRPWNAVSGYSSAAPANGKTYNKEYAMILHRRFYLLYICAALILINLVGCTSLCGCLPQAEDLDSVDYAPLILSDWAVSNPVAESLDPNLVAELYFKAAKLSTLYGLLVIKNGNLVAEGYFTEGAADRETVLASVTKSYTSALVGIAIEQGHLADLDQKMIDFFPEFADQITDPRKLQITIRQMLQMRSGYPWEERTPPYMDMIFSNFDWLPFILDFPLTNDPGSAFGYSNLTTHLLGIIVARASDMDLKSFGQEHLFSPINAQVGDWWQDANNYYLGAGLISFTARDAAKFGLLYLNDGRFDGNQIVSEEWVVKSLQSYSENINYTGWLPGTSKLGRYFSDIGYGYQWMSAKVGAHHVNFAWGHGGNLIVLLEALDMVIVTTANDLHGLFGQEAWKHERAIIDLIGEFINCLPAE